MREIEGKTKLLGVIGWPVKHSLSPPMHNAVLEQLGMDYAYVALPVAPECVKDAVFGLRALGFVGINVTIPHKQAFIEFMDELSEEVKAIGALNTIHIKDDKFFGYNTDADGFIRSLEEDGDMSVGGKRITLVGAGGVGRAIATACVLNGAEQVGITDISSDRVEDLCKALGCVDVPTEVVAIERGEGALSSAIAASDIIINATPVGMKAEDPLPVAVDHFRSDAFVFDAIYNVGDTRLLVEARNRGCRTLNGLGMLAYQGARSFEIWTGTKPDVGTMKSVLRKHIGVE